MYRALLAELERQGTPIRRPTEISDIDLATNTVEAAMTPQINRLTLQYRE